MINDNDSKNVSTATDEKLLRLPQVLAKIPLGRSTFLAGIKAKRFPAPIKLRRITLWYASEIDQFIKDARKGGF